MPCFNLSCRDHTDTQLRSQTLTGLLEEALDMECLVDFGDEELNCPCHSHYSCTHRMKADDYRYPIVHAPRVD